MKKLWVLLFCMSFSVLAATPQQALSSRLAKNSGFSAHFSQKVTSPDGDVLVNGEGQVDIARPSLFRWHTTAPDDNLLVSDGKTLWYYSPMVEQVTIYWQEQATKQTPFVLLTRNRPSDWEHYKVTQNGDEFILVPSAAGTGQGEFHIVIDTQGVVHRFDVIEQDGQKSVFTFDHVKLGKPNGELFSFHIPDGVEVDDQRN